MVLKTKKFRNKRGGKTFSESWSQGTNDIQIGANKANEQRKKIMSGINQGMIDVTNGFRNQQYKNQISSMSPSLTIGGRRKKLSKRRSRKTKRTRRKRKTRRRKTKKNRRRR